MRAAEKYSVSEQSVNPVDEARTAIWRLFQEGYVDEDTATAGLLAVDLGTRRTHRNAMSGSYPGQNEEREQADR